MLDEMDLDSCLSRGPWLEFPKDARGKLEIVEFGTQSDERMAHLHLQRFLKLMQRCFSDAWP